MKESVVLRLFAQSARLQKKRATLTVAAIAWGTVAIALLLAFGEGLRLQLDRNRRAMGENIAVIWPGETTKPWKGLPPGRHVRLKVDDVAYVNERVPEAQAIGEITAGRASLTYGKKTVAGRVLGVTWTYGDIRKHYPQPGGRFFGSRDEAKKRRVIFLGDELAADLFAKEPPVGRTLLLNDVPYTVVGVMKKKIQMGMYGGPDALHAVIPITTFQAQFGDDELNNFVVKVARPKDLKPAMRRVNEVLGAKYQFDPQDERVLGYWDTVKSAKNMAGMLLGIEIFLGVIGSLTLLIGGVGVANIMYAVVKERTREIGVKMALGAKERWITLPFVLEGVLYTALGGVIGIAIATMIVSVLALVPTEGVKALEFMGKPVLSLPIMLTTTALLGLLGILAGWFPARRAAAIDPAATLRYE